MLDIKKLIQGVLDKSKDVQEAFKAKHSEEDIKIIMANWSKISTQASMAVVTLVSYGHKVEAGVDLVCETINIVKDKMTLEDFRKLPIEKQFIFRTMITEFIDPPVEEVFNQIIAYGISEERAGHLVKATLELTVEVVKIGHADLVNAVFTEGLK